MALPALPLDLYTAAQARALDQLAAKNWGLPSLTLMERAGAAAVQRLTRRYPGARNLLVVCGGGNNGGDGYVAARLALEKGLAARVAAVADPERLQGDAAHCARRFAEAGPGLIEKTLSPAAFDSADLIVDALFGTGLSRAPQGAFLDAIGMINDAAAPALALDLPSGLCADTGNPLGAAVKADATLSFIVLKRGLFTGAGPEFCGEVLFDDLGAPAELYKEVKAGAVLIDPVAVSQRLPRRPRHAHKGDCGHALIIGGERGYLGAAVLAGSAAARAGAGLVTVATRPEHAAQLALFRPELMTVALNAPQDLRAPLRRADVVALGPGLGQWDWGSGLFAQALETPLPMVVDADALNLLAADPQRRQNWVLTPHPGEAARLLGTSVQALQADRFAAVAVVREKFGGTALLKGAGSLVLEAQGPIQVNRSGNPGMATGGMGDVLTGLIAGLMAQGMAPGAAAVAGVCLHGQAADACAAANGPRGLLAGDLLAALPSLLNPG